MTKKRKDILIHPNRIEDLDKTRAELRKKAIKPQATGYSSICRIRNTRWHRDIIFKADFIAEKLKSMTFMVFHPIGEEKGSTVLPPAMCSTVFWVSTEGLLSRPSLTEFLNRARSYVSAVLIRLPRATPSCLRNGKSWTM